MNSTVAPGVTTPAPGANSSGHVNASGYLHDDQDFTSGELLILRELNLILLACVITIIPLVLILAAAIALRRFCMKWKEERLAGAMRRTDSEGPNKSSHLLLPDEIKTSESQFSVIPVEELEEVMTTYMSAPSVNTNNHNHTSMSTANGSIITMTMKNNHLIVETEMRIQDVTSPSVEEVEKDDSTALVHQTEEVGPNTGLSQSDLSLSSGSGNPSYCYGNQSEYLADEREPQEQAHSTTAIRLKHVPFVVQPSHDIEDDDLYLEQQHQLGNGLDDVQTVSDVFPMHCNPYENPGFVATPEQPQVNPIS